MKGWVDFGTTQWLWIWMPGVGIGFSARLGSEIAVNLVIIRGFEEKPLGFTYTLQKRNVNQIFVFQYLSYQFCTQFSSRKLEKWNVDAFKQIWLPKDKFYQKSAKTKAVVKRKRV